MDHTSNALFSFLYTLEMRQKFKQTLKANIITVCIIDASAHAAQKREIFLEHGAAADFGVCDCFYI